MCRYSLPPLILCILLATLTQQFHASVGAPESLKTTKRHLVLRSKRALWMAFLLAGLAIQALFLYKHLRAEFVS
jgi:hypothetical protein